MLSFAANAPSKPPVSIQATLDQTEVKIGDVFHYTINLKWNPNKVNEPNLEDLQFVEAFELIATIAGEKQELDVDIFSKSIDYQLMAFEDGELLLTAVKLNYTLTGAESKSGIATSEALKINVADVPPDDAETPDLRDKKITFSIPPSRKWLYITAAIALVVTTLAALLIFLWLKKRKRPIFRQPPPLIPIETIAIEKIDALVASDLLEQQRVREFFEELSMILREYFGLRFHFQAIDMTSSEVETSMGEFINTELLEALVDLDARSDLAKFAEWMPSEKEIEALVRIAREMIWSTIPQAVADDEADKQTEAVQEVKS